MPISEALVDSITQGPEGSSHSIYEIAKFQFERKLLDREMEFEEKKKKLFAKRKFHF